MLRVIGGFAISLVTLWLLIAFWNPTASAAASNGQVRAADVTCTTTVNQPVTTTTTSTTTQPVTITTTQPVTTTITQPVTTTTQVVSTTTQTQLTPIFFTTTATTSTVYTSTVTTVVTSTRVIVNTLAGTADAPASAQEDCAPATPTPSYAVTVSTQGNGTVSPGSGTYSGTQGFTATPAAGQVFLGWTVDGTFVGFGNPLNLPVTKDRTVVAAFAPIPAFCDVTTATANYTAITQLAARGVITGVDNPNGGGKCFNGNDYLARVQVAGFVARAFGWDKKDHGNAFTDKGSVDDALWRDAGTLAFYDVARGYRDGTYDPTGNVLHTQSVSFVTRAMIRKGYWAVQDDNASYYTAVPTTTGHRQDLTTYYTYAGNIPGTAAPTDSQGGPNGYDGQATRNYFVNVLWQAYSSYFSTNHIP